MRVFRWPLLLALFVLELYSTQRIVALSPSVTELLFALGAGERVVGTTQHAIYPKEAAALPRVGGFFNPSLERILALRPTLVVLQNHTPALNTQLQRLGIETLMLNVSSLTAIQNSIQRLSKRLNTPKKGAKLLHAFQEAKARLKALPRKKKRLLILFSVPKSLHKPLYAAGRNLYFHELITLAGCENAMTSQRAGQPVLDLEAIIHYNPDIMLLLAPNATPSDILTPWRSVPIKAAKTEAIYLFNQPYATMPSHRLIALMHDLANTLEAYYATHR